MQGIFPDAPSHLVGRDVGPRSRSGVHGKPDTCVPEVLAGQVHAAIHLFTASLMLPQAVTTPPEQIGTRGAVAKLPMRPHETAPALSRAPGR